MFRLLKIALRLNSNRPFMALYYISQTSICIQPEDGLLRAETSF